jgi:hypothetical protein
MELGHRVTIIDSETELVLQCDVSIPLSRTEQTGILTMGIGFAQRPKVSGVSIPFHRITAVAESLEVGYVVAAPMVPRKDMVNFENTLPI